MTIKYSDIDSTCKGKPFFFFLLSQGISNFGDAYHFIAITALLVKISGSGLSATFGIVCSPLLSIIFSSLAGYLGDTFKEKNVMILLDILRGVVVLQFMTCRDLVGLYGLIVTLSLLDLFYSPSRKKIISNILAPNEILKCYSYISGVSGVAFILGSTLSGLFIHKFGINMAFLINGMSFFCSAFFTQLISCKSSASRISDNNNIKVTDSIKAGIRYLSNNQNVKYLIAVCTSISFVATSINIVFFPYAFDRLGITSREWGFMMSIYYGTNLMPLVFTSFLEKNMKSSLSYIIPMITVAFVWMSYGMTTKIASVYILQFIEGTMMAVAGIVLSTQLQLNIKTDVMARVMGINDILNNIGRLVSIILTYCLLLIIDQNQIFIFSAIVIILSMLFFGMYYYFNSRRKEI